ANVVSKYFGEQNSKTKPLTQFVHIASHEPVPSNVICAVSVCITSNYRYISNVMSDKTQVFVGKGDLKYLMKHRDVLSQLPHYNEIIAMDPKTVMQRDFDRLITLDAFDLKGLTIDEAYDEGSSNHYLDGIQIPNLIISTNNDPISMNLEIIQNDIFGKDGIENKNVSALIFPTGGHIGLFSAFSTKKRIDEELILKYFQYYFSENNDQKTQ
ncbi:MAG: hypothetical protein EZS28_019286, partial [Streblomastix strix]